MRQRLTSCGYASLRARLDMPDEASSGGDILFRARYSCYLVLGFAPEHAFFLAMAPDVTVIGALTLIENDCPPETAVAILT